MGYVEIIRDWEQCDKCDRNIAVSEGTYTQSDGLTLIFTCKVCK